MISVLLFWIFPFSLGDPYAFEWNSGNFDYTCSGLGTGWILAGESCFFPYTLGQFNFSAAGTFCRNSELHFSAAAVVDNWLVAGSLRNRVPPTLYWTGVSTFNATAVFMKPLQLTESTYNPLWAADQPPISANRSSCVALDLSSSETVGWRLIDCVQPRNVLCETFACLPNTFRCKDNSRCIPQNATHDNVFDCQDGSDEDPLTISRASAQVDCRHLLLKGSGEFTSPNFPGGYPPGTTCQWDVEAYPNKVISFNIEGYSPHLTVEENGAVVDISDRDPFSRVTTSRFLSFRLSSPGAGNGFRVKFYSTDPSHCQLQDGVAVYDSFSTPFDCSYSAAAPVSSQFLLFLVEDMQKSSLASVNVTGADYSFGFTDPPHSQAVVIPAGVATLTVRDAWRASSLTSFRIRVIPIGSTCLVVPLTAQGLSLHWPSQLAPSYIPHCLSFAMLGNHGHTWRVDQLQTSPLDSVNLITKQNGLTITSPCSYRGYEPISLAIKQLSADFSISFKVSKDCVWPSGSYSWGSEVACVDGSRVQSSECQLGGVWSVEPSICLSQADDNQPDVCTLSTMQYAYPVSVSYKVGGVLSFRCMPTFFAYGDTPCSNGVCFSTCQEDGTWSGHIDCNTQNTCPPPVEHDGATPLYSTSYKYGKVINYTTPEGMLDATAYSVCMDGGSPYAPEWQYYGFKFIKPLCLSFPIDFGTFDFAQYENGTTASITCISGYFVNGSTTCLEGVWTNLDVSCILQTPSTDPCLPNGRLVHNETLWMCSCSSGYEPIGNPSQQTCRLWNACLDGTNLCDEGATCVDTSTEIQKSYTCICPPDTVLYTGPTNETYGLVENVTCVVPCKINDILLPLQPTHYIHGYQDPPRNSTFSLYCSATPRGLGGRFTYVKYGLQTCGEILGALNDGIFKDICNTVCDTKDYLTYPTLALPQSTGIYNTVTLYCNPGEVLIGSNTLVCSPRGNFFNYPYTPFCSVPSCSALDVFLPGLNSSTSYVVNSTIATGCDPQYIYCTQPPGQLYPKWSSNFSCQSTTLAMSAPSGPTGLPSTYTVPFFMGSSQGHATSGLSSTQLPRYPRSVSKGRRRTKRSISCMDNINFCSNGRCNPLTEGCDCNSGYHFNDISMQCEVNMWYYWCSSKGSYNGSCACTGGYGLGGFNDSAFCMDGPACPTCPTGQCAFMGAEWEDTLNQSCVSEYSHALTIDGQTPSNGICPCKNGGYCMGIAPNTLPCKCFNSWTGEFCETSRLCEGVECQNGGTCSVSLNGNCLCFSGWTGDRCQTLLDHCDPNQCVNGDCQNFAQGYFCKCHPGYTGQVCDQQIDFCSYKNPCVSGQCLNAQNASDVHCECDHGYTGAYCDQPVADPCDGQCGGDVCLSLLYPKYTCLCTSFDSKPTNNNDPPNCNGTVRYCDFQPCFNGGSCVERGGTQVGYYCSCFPGFNGTNCQVMNDQCNQTNCHHGDCLWSEDDGTYCQCHPGYTGSICNTPIPCDLDCKYGMCQLNGIDPFCNCTSPYTGPYCNLTTIPCDSSCVHGTCQNDGEDPLGYYCNCTLGYKGDNCEETKDCSDMGWSCSNGGSCHVEIEGNTITQHCDCPLGVTGDTCQYYGSRCSPNYCQNGGNCTELGLTVICVCPDDFSGDHCEFSKSKSFNLLWTGYSSTQQFVSPQRNTTLYREFTLCGWVQYAPPTAVKSDMVLPPFMGIITSNNPDVLNIDNQGLLINRNRIIEVTITALQWHHVCIRTPSDTVDIKDKPIWNYFLDGVSVANATESPLPQNNFALYMVCLAPPNSAGKGTFQGEISEVQLYYTRLDDRDIASLAYQCSSTRLNPRPLVDWDNFTSLDRGNPGVMQLQPGICDLSNCLPGRESGTACFGLKDKIPPVVLTCPTDIRKLSYERTTQITWDPPTFQDNVGIDHVTNNFRPGEYFPWGYYKVIYVAYDAAGNTATCQFAIMVAPDNCTVQDPVGGTVDWRIVNGTNSGMIARVKCFDDFYPKADPEFFVCDVLGQWDRVSSFASDSPFNFPSCGDTVTAVQNVTGSVTANGTCQEVYNRLNNTLAPFCNSTNCVEIAPQCEDSFLRVPRSAISDGVQHFDFMLVVNNTRVAVVNPIKQNLSNAFPYDESFASASYTCDPNFPKQNVDAQYASCAECAAGTLWNEETAECEDCPPDTYRKPPMDSCAPCPDNKITGGLSRAPSVLFCYKNCTVGYYYNASLGDCSPAPFGYYQNNTGRTEYISCPLYTSTSRIGETNVEGCNRTCILGQEFAADRRSCVLCAIGSYKSTEQSGCIPCPEGRSTSGEGSKQMSACDVLWCPPNTFVGNVTYPVDLSLSKYEICPSCPMGTFQPEYNQTVCVPCSTLDDAPTCPLTSTCSPSNDMCNSNGRNDTCTQLENVTITNIPIYSCASTVTVSPGGNSSSSKTVVIVAVTVSVVVLTIALVVVGWIFRHRIFCCKYIRKREDVLRMTTNDVYRAPRVVNRRALTTTTVSSNKSDVSGNGLASSAEPERPRMLPPPIITSRSALEAMRTPQIPVSIPRISASTPRSFRQSDEEPVVRDDDEEEEEEDDDDYFG